jgi:two-component system sensor histidine kinase KdpD
MQPFLQGRRITEDVPEHLPPVELDYLQIDQVLTNLLENVIRYTPSGSPIEICVRVRGNDIIISVADRGPGIPPGDLERIFDKFYRVLDGPAKGERAKSSGLGLAVCRGIVEAHSGRIWAENRRGGGAIFYVALPVKETEGGLHG